VALKYTQYSVLAHINDTTRDILKLCYASVTVVGQPHGVSRSKWPV